MPVLPWVFNKFPISNKPNWLDHIIWAVVRYDGSSQLRFRVFLPVGKSLILHWGDGTTTEALGTGANKNYDSSYVSNGEYQFYVTGDVSSILRINLRAVENYETGLYVEAPIDRYNEITDLQWLTGNHTNFTGSITSLSNLPLLYLAIGGGYGYVGCSVYGDISTLAPSASTIQLSITTTGKLTCNSRNAFGLSDAWISLVGNMVSDDVDRLIGAFKNCTGCEISFTGNSQRTEESNADLLTLIDNNDAIFVSEIESLPLTGAELHTDANAASDPNENEADAITGWSESGLNGTGNNVFESQADVVNVGSYAFKMDCNDVPTSAAGINKDFAVDSGSIYRVVADLRHVGVGSEWRFGVDNLNTPFVINNFDLIYKEIACYRKATSTTLNVNFREIGSSNDGGIYADNISLKKVAIS